jgi:hypothetical protein
MSISWILGESHVATMGELGLVVMFASWTLFVAVFIWILYVALEPFVRRRWPATIVSWSRLLAGEVRDPLVGRDLLFGSAFGAAFSVIILSGRLLPSFFGRAPETPLFWERRFSRISRVKAGPRQLAGGPQITCQSRLVCLMS